MRRVVVCYKWVIDEADIKVAESTRALNFSNAGHKISPYDRNAIETGMQIVEKEGGVCTALSAGADKEVSNSRKDVLSRGPENGYVVIGSQLDTADSLVTANVLSGAVKKMGDADIVICGEGSSDAYTQQVGPRIAQALGWPVITYVTKVEINGDRVTAYRAVEEGTEVIESPLPVVLTILGDSNKPRIPGLKQVMGAGKKQFDTWSIEDLGMAQEQTMAKVATVKTIGNIPERKQVIIEGEPAKAASELVRLIIREGVLS